MNRVQTAAHMEGQQLFTDLKKANGRILELTRQLEGTNAEIKSLELSSRSLVKEIKRLSGNGSDTKDGTELG